jgi:hypothetical protein
MRFENIIYRLVIYSIFLLTAQACIKDDPIVLPVEEAEEDDTVPDEDDVVIDSDTIKINWVNWYLSVPLDNGQGKATSIFYEAIKSDNLNAEQSEFFFKNEEDTSYTMYTHFTGYTTSGEYPLEGGAYCRTELREFWQGNQTTSDNWYMDSGTHLLESTLQVDYCECKVQTYVAQFHGKSSGIVGITNSPATVKVMWDNGQLKIEYYIKPVGDEWTSNDILKIYIGQVDNEIFTIKLRVENGGIGLWTFVSVKGH